MVIVKDLNSKINGQVLLFRRPLFQLNVFTWWESSLHPLWPHPGEFEVRKAAHQHRPRSAGVLRVFDLQKSPEQSTQFSWSHFFTRDQRKRLGRALRQTDQTVIFSFSVKPLSETDSSVFRVQFCHCLRAEANKIIFKLFSFCSFARKRFLSLV